MDLPKLAQWLASSYHVTVLLHGASPIKHDTSFGVLTGNAIETISFKAGDVIFREGDNALDLFIIKSGQVLIQIGNRTVTGELAPDTIFGEMALIDDEGGRAAQQPSPPPMWSWGSPSRKSNSCFS